MRVSGFGQDGPYAGRAGYGTVAEAFSGVPSFTGFPDKPPTLPGFPVADSIAATFAAMAAMFAIYKRDQGGLGTGQEIDVSLFEPLFRLVEAQVIGYDQLGIVKERQGNRLAEDSPRKHLPHPRRPLDRDLGKLAAHLRAPGRDHGDAGAGNRSAIPGKLQSLPARRSA